MCYASIELACSCIVCIINICVNHICRKSQFKVGTQQDSQEMLRYLLQKLKEEETQVHI